jgi:hypothetical protein
MEHRSGTGLMPHHYTKDTTEAYEFCNTCNRLTLHAVSGGRRGHCKEHGPKGLTKAQQKRKKKREKEEREQRLFL